MFKLNMFSKSSYHKCSIDEKLNVSILFNQTNNFESQTELLAFQKALMTFGITIEDLVNYGPKHKNTINSCIHIAKQLSENMVLFEKLVSNQNFPMNELLKKASVHQRTIQKNRKFIIALVLIQRSNLNVLQQYIKNIEKKHHC